MYNVEIYNKSQKRFQMKGDSAREKKKEMKSVSLQGLGRRNTKRVRNLYEDRGKMMRDEMYQGNGPPLRIVIEEERMRRKEPMVNL